MPTESFSWERMNLRIAQSDSSQILIKQEKEKRGLGVGGGFAEAPVDGDFHHLGDFVDVGEGEILLQLGLNGLPVALLE